MKLVKPNTNKFHFDNIFAEQSFETEDFEIIQIGDLLCDGDTVIEEHRQEVDLELTFVAEPSTPTGLPPSPKKSTSISLSAATCTRSSRQS